MVHVVVIAATFTHESAKDILREVKGIFYLRQQRAWSLWIATKRLERVLQVS